MNLAIRAVFGGAVIALLHLGLSFLLFLYFGLGMSRGGSAFVVDVLMQPATAIARALENRGYGDPFNPFVMNLTFYWLLGAVLMGRICTNGPTWTASADHREALRSSDRLSELLHFLLGDQSIQYLFHEQLLVSRQRFDVLEHPKQLSILKIGPRSSVRRSFDQVVD